nr:glutamic acid-rich protein-like [Tanacetum cinerariifolium]
MVAILVKTEHNTDFYQIVDFLEASHIRRHVKLNDEKGISSLPDVELFENLSLMGYNILPNQRFTFQKGQFSHQWKFFIHTIMQCLSLKSTGFNEFSSNIATAVVSLATNKVYNFLKMIFDGMVRNINSNGTKFLIMQQTIHELMELCTSLQRQQSQMAAKIKDQDLEISRLKARVKSLEDKDRRSVEPTQEDAPIIGGIKEIGEELGVDKSIELGSNDTKEMVNVLSSMKAANILTSGGAVASVSPADVLLAAGVDIC